MTANQIKYWDLQRQKQADAEAARANAAKEELQRQANAETARANLAREIENRRSNYAREAENARSNYARERENIRANNMDQLLRSTGLSIQSSYNQGQLENARRANELRNMEVQVSQARNLLDSEKNRETILQNARSNALRMDELSEQKRRNTQDYKSKQTSTFIGLLGSLANTAGRYLAGRRR